MMPTDRIRAYLSDSSATYQQGVNLLYDVTLKEGVRNSLQRYPSPTKLRAYLLEVFAELDKDCPKEEQTTSANSITDTLASDDILDSLRSERVLVFKKLSAEHTLMRTASTDEDRYLHILACIELDIHSLDLRDKIAYYLHHGKLPVRISKPKIKDCTESQAHTIVRIKQLPQSIYADRKLLAQLKKSRSDTQVVSEISAINLRIQAVQDRLKTKISEQRRLNRFLKEN